MKGLTGSIFRHPDTLAIAIAIGGGPFFSLVNSQTRRVAPQQGRVTQSVDHALELRQKLR
jgi:hypothetical protein